MEPSLEERRQRLISFYKVHDEVNIKNVDMFVKKVTWCRTLELLKDKYGTDPGEAAYAPAVQFGNFSQHLDRLGQTWTFANRPFGINFVEFTSELTGELLGCKVLSIKEEHQSKGVVGRYITRVGCTDTVRVPHIDWLSSYSVRAV